MATMSKPLSMQTKHRSKSEKEAIAKAEEMLNTSNSKVYTPPARLNKTTKEIYKSLVDNLKPLDILNDLDIDLLCVTADALYQMQVARENIDKYGQVFYVFDEDGSLVKATKNPAVDVVKNYESIFKSGCSQLCLSPAARAKLSIDLADMLKNDTKNETTQEDKDLNWLMGGN